MTLTFSSDGSSEHTCPHCGGDLVPGKLYCPSCGLALAPPDYKVNIDAYVAAKVAQEVNILTKDQAAVVREISNKAEDEVWRRLKRYTWLVGASVVLLGLYGFRSIQDAKKMIVEQAQQRVEPVVKQVENRTQAVQAQLGNVEVKLPLVTTSLDKTSKLADDQRRRIEGQSSEIASKLNSFQVASTKADQLSENFEVKVVSAQHHLDELTKRYNAQLTQIAQAANHQSVLEAFPGLEQEPFIQIQNVRFDKQEKRKGDKWVDVYVNSDAIAAKTISLAKLELLISDLRAAGFTPFIGTITTGGNLSGIIDNAGQGAYESNHIYYYHQSFESFAQDLAKLTSKYIRLSPADPLKADPSNVASFLKLRLAFLIKDNKLDAQVYISGPPQ